MEDHSAPLAAPPGPSHRLRQLAQIYRRDPLAEGRFWYSVVTTGVYCRPTCPSRRALTGNIRLHHTLAEARATGFRPCGRCHPEAPSQIDRHRVLIQTVCGLIEAGGAPPFRIIATDMGLSPAHLHRVFRRVTGTTPSTYARLRARAGVDRFSPEDGSAQPVAGDLRSIASGEETSS